MVQAKILLIGGPPGGGKTTTGQTVAGRLGSESLTLDDIVPAIKAMVPPEENPDLHAMSGIPPHEYFTTTSPDGLLADTERAHAALWPAVEAVIRYRCGVGAPVVIDGYHLLPERVAELDRSDVFAVFLDVDPAELERRERALSWYERSVDPPTMLANFLGRSNGWNARIAASAHDHDLAVITQDGSKSVDDVVDEIVGLLGG